MGTQRSIKDYILDQASGLDVRAHKMFGNYALYCDEKVVGLVCNDELFVKITETGKEYIGEHYIEGFAYPGAKASMHISGDLVEDRDWLKDLLQLTADALPMPKPKKKKKK